MPGGFPVLTPEQRVLRARIAAHAQWANTPDRTARMTAANAGRFARFEREVDPEGRLDPEERRRRAKHAEQAHMLRLALKSSKARAARAASRREGDGDGGAAA
jgi:hypothetical protein